MKKRGLTPKHVVFTSLFNACANSPWPFTDGLQRATKLHKQLMENGIILNNTSSHAMIKGRIYILFIGIFIIFILHLKIFFMGF